MDRSKQHSSEKEIGYILIYALDYRFVTPLSIIQLLAY